MNIGIRFPLLHRLSWPLLCAALLSTAAHANFLYVAAESTTGGPIDGVQVFVDGSLVGVTGSPGRAGSLKLSTGGTITVQKAGYVLDYQNPPILSKRKFQKPDQIILSGDKQLAVGPVTQDLSKEKGQDLQVTFHLWKTSGARDATTLGIEWEQKQHGIDVGEAEGHNARILCSTAQASGGFPLVSMTYDMQWKTFRAPQEVRTLEIVTGPIKQGDTASWNAVLAFLTSFYKQLGAHCANRQYADDKKTPNLCTVDVTTLLAQMNHGLEKPVATTTCYSGKDAGKNLPENQRDHVRFLVYSPRTPPDDLWEAIRDGFKANTQVNVGIDLDKLLTVDLETLYGKKSVPGHGAYVAFFGTGLNGAKLAALKEDTTLTDDEKGFIALYYLSLNSYAAYFYKNYAKDAKEANKTLVNHLKTANSGAPIVISIESVAASIKNGFGLLPKSQLNVVYAHLLASNPGFAAKAFGGSRNAAYYCDYPADNEEQRNACKDIHDNLWLVKLRANQDPINLGELSTGVFGLVPTSVPVRRVVLEMREDEGGLSLIQKRKITATGAADEFALQYKGTVTLPAGLP